MPSRLVPWHVGLLVLTALPLVGAGAWLVLTARGSLPQVQLFFGLVLVAIGVLDAILTTVMAVRGATSLLRLFVIHGFGLAACVTFVVLPLWLINQ